MHVGVFGRAESAGGAVEGRQSWGAWRSRADSLSCPIAAGEVEAGVDGSNASQVWGDVSGGVSGHESKSLQRRLLLEAWVRVASGLWPGTCVSWA